mmetsp:Transcript_51684/g.77141  ORF Transcript_51684/g.77141 Transcript_51684/m.77141 type:complete len:90 (+) Transcript_51684:435-704(+)
MLRCLYLRRASSLLSTLEAGEYGTFDSFRGEAGGERTCLCLAFNLRSSLEGVDFDPVPSSRNDGDRERLLWDLLLRSLRPLRYSLVDDA